MDAVRRRVAVYLPSGPGYFARVFQGIGAYHRTHRHWTFVGWPGHRWQDEAHLRRALEHDRIDGVIAGASRFWDEVLSRPGAPAFVNVENNGYPHIPQVAADEEAVGRLAAEHFRERGLRNLGAVAEAGSLPPQIRLRSFLAAVRAWAPHPVHVYQAPYGGVDLETIRPWLRTLPRPIGILCWHDEAAKVVHQACESEGLRIPEDVALLGVDNDDGLCGFLEPPLSSIDINAHQIGYEAAALLDRLMDGQRPPPRRLLVPPVGVVARASTELLAIDDPDVAEALRFIRHNVGRPLRVKDVLDHVAISRRSLEMRFRAAIGRTPRQEIQRTAVQRAQQLLADTDLPIPAIAARCGYPRPNHFTVMFRRQSGQTPTAYRRQLRVTE